MMLMHKNIPVAKVSTDRENILYIIAPEELPVGITTQYAALTDTLYKNWRSDRTIPSIRQNMKNITRTLGTSILDATLNSLEVSRTDCYWFNSEDDYTAQLQWER